MVGSFPPFLRDDPDRNPWSYHYNVLRLNIELLDKVLAFWCYKCPAAWACLDRLPTGRRLFRCLRRSSATISEISDVLWLWIRRMYGPRDPHVLLTPLHRSCQFLAGRLMEVARTMAFYGFSSPKAQFLLRTVWRRSTALI